MARGHGRILSTIWEDNDFIALDRAQQGTYLFLISQPNLNHAGLLPLTLRRWSRKAHGLTTAGLEKTLAELDAARFIVLDDDTEELLIRSFIRNDGVWRQPRVMGAAVSGALEISSRLLRRALLEEMNRIPLCELSDDPGTRAVSIRQEVEGHIDTLRRAFWEPEPDPSARLREAPAEGVAEAPREGPAEGGPQGSTHVRAEASRALSPTPTPVPNPGTDEQPLASVVDLRPATPTVVEPVRLDVESVCTLLADLIEANGSRRPSITDAWRTAARLLIDKDKIPVDNVRAAITWCQADEFWRGNVLSMPTLRKQYDRLRHAAIRSQRHLAPTGTDGLPQSTADRRVAEALALAARLAQEDDQP